MGKNATDAAISQSELQAFVTMLTETAMSAAFTVVADYIQASIPDDYEDPAYSAIVDETTPFQADEPLRVAFQAAQSMLRMQDPETAVEQDVVCKRLASVLRSSPPSMEGSYVRALAHLILAHASGPVPDLGHLHLAAECEPESTFIQGLILAAQTQRVMRSEAHTRSAESHTRSAKR